MPQTIEDSLVFNALVFLHTLKEENSPSRAPVIVNTLLAVFFTRNYWQPQTGKHYHISGCFSDDDQSLLSFTLASNCFILGSLL